MGLSVTPGNEKFRHEALQSLDPIGFTFKALLDLPFLSSKGPVQIVWALEIGCVQMRVVILHLGETRSSYMRSPPFKPTLGVIAMTSTAANIAWATEGT